MFFRSFPISSYFRNCPYFCFLGDVIDHAKALRSAETFKHLRPLCLKIA